MLGYICKYTPVEIFEAMDTEIVRIEPSAVSFTQADTLMHSNICSFAKGVLETFGETDYEGLVFTTCCDSMRRLYDVLKRRFPEKFFYMLDLPRKVNEFAASLYEKQIRDMAMAYADFSGKTFHEEKLLEICRRKAESSRLRQSPAKEPSLRIGLAGARPGRELKNMLEDLNVEILFDLTCTGLARNFSPDSTQPLGSYSYALLNQIPCMRMMKASNRIKFIDGFRDRLDGIIYHTIKFCDIYSYEYEYLKNEKDIPIVLVETDTTPQCQGQIRTRIEAFIESLKISRGIARQKPDTGTSRQEDRPMYVLGIDSGSTSTKDLGFFGNPYRSQKRGQRPAGTGTDTGTGGAETRRSVPYYFHRLRPGQYPLCPAECNRNQLPRQRRSFSESGCPHDPGYRRPGFQGHTHKR